MDMEQLTQEVNASHDAIWRSRERGITEGFYFDLVTRWNAEAIEALKQAMRVER
jgi:hypothetical protein